MTDEDEQRKAAIKRIEAKRAFRMHLALYVLVNLLLIVVWALTGRGYLWPVWPISGWGIGIAFHYWSVYARSAKGSVVWPIAATHCAIPAQAMP